MLDRVDFEPVFFAPFVSSVMTVEPAWIDQNGHLNMAYYNVLFDRGLDEAFSLVGLGWDYLKERGNSTFTAEVACPLPARIACRRPGARHLPVARFRPQAPAHLPAAVPRHRRLGVGHRRKLSLHVDMSAKKVAPFPVDVMKRLAAQKKSHGRLPRPEAAGKRIAMPEKA